MRYTLVDTSKAITQPTPAYVEAMVYKDATFTAAMTPDEFTGEKLCLTDEG